MYVYETGKIHGIALSIKKMDKGKTGANRGGAGNGLEKLLFMQGATDQETGMVCGRRIWVDMAHPTLAFLPSPVPIPFVFYSIEFFKKVVSLS